MTKTLLQHGEDGGEARTEIIKITKLKERKNICSNLSFSDSLIIDFYFRNLLYFVESLCLQKMTWVQKLNKSKSILQAQLIEKLSFFGDEEEKKMCFKNNYFKSLLKQPHEPTPWSYTHILVLNVLWHGTMTALFSPF